MLFHESWCSYTGHRFITWTWVKARIGLPFNFLQPCNPQEWPKGGIRLLLSLFRTVLGRLLVPIKNPTWFRSSISFQKLIYWLELPILNSSNQRFEFKFHQISRLKDISNGILIKGRSVGRSHLYCLECVLNICRWETCWKKDNKISLKSQMSESRRMASIPIRGPTSTSTFTFTLQEQSMNKNIDVFMNNIQINPRKASTLFILKV